MSNLFRFLNVIPTCAIVAISLNHFGQQTRFACATAVNLQQCKCHCSDLTRILSMFNIQNINCFFFVCSSSSIEIVQPVITPLKSNRSFKFVTSDASLIIRHAAEPLDLLFFNISVGKCFKCSFKLLHRDHLSFALLSANECHCRARGHRITHECGVHLFVVDTSSEAIRARKEWEEEKNVWSLWKRRRRWRHPLASQWIIIK